MEDIGFITKKALFQAQTQVNEEEYQYFLRRHPMMKCSYLPEIMKEDEDGFHYYEFINFEGHVEKHYLCLDPYKWPEGSQLSRDHFTIDWQQCLNCEKVLDGWLLPMNKPPCWLYLFCESCRNNDDCKERMKCGLCGKLYNTIISLNLCHHPANSAYFGAGDLHRLICDYCLQDQKENQPGPEETRDMMKKWIQHRDECEAEEKLAGFSRKAFSQYQSDPFYKSNFKTPIGGKKRKLDKDGE